VSRRIKVFISLVALLAAAVVGWYVYRRFDQMVTTAEVVTPAQPIPAGALIEGEMLTRREVPRPLLDEEIYVEAEALVSRVAAVPLHPGMIVYGPFAVEQKSYRMVDDPALEVISFPVDPARAVGGQIQPGHRVDLWRLTSVRPGRAVTLTELIATRWATATLLVESAPVVDVRAKSGQPVARQPQAMPGQLGEGETSSGSSTSTQRSSPLQILTVGVPPQVARTILTLVAEEQAGAELWVGLSPLRRRSPTEDRGSGHGMSPASEKGRVIRTPESGSSPSQTVTVTVATAEPGVATRGVISGTGEAVDVHAAPGGEVVGTLSIGSSVVLVKGPVVHEDVHWQMVEAGGMKGWVTKQQVEVVTP
jgi:Flp pilus assembly protein CpaB